ncbi:MAG TPA: hypothetical protein VFQ61_29700 [Polyangiaceae bacterium]|nr:hypothetical protein [Polyangiaceae bacterium]
MMNATLRMMIVSGGLATLALSSTALAQEATVQGQVGMGLPGAAPQTATATRAAGGTDHSLVVGHLGVGYLGRSQIQVGAPGGPGGSAAVAAPIIGVRYWMDPTLGIDVGLGFGFDGGSNTNAGVDTDQPSHWAFLLHGGVPLALAAGRHYTFEIVPEANVGFGGGSATVNGVDISNKGFMLDLGARVGSEIQFGFMGIPELALQASVGALFATSSASSTPDGGGKVSQSQTSFRTTVYNSPWAIFSSNVAALYYF